MPDPRKRAQPSGFSAIFDIEKGQLVILSEMNHGRHSHGLCMLEEEVYVIGGVTAKEYSTGRVERFNVVQKSW